MSHINKKCPVCKLDNQPVLDDQDYGDKITYDCARCGCYTISSAAETIADHAGKSAELSGWLRERNILGIEIPMLNFDFLTRVVNTLPRYTPIEKQSKLLKAIELLTDYPGKRVILTPEQDASLSWANNEQEFIYYLKSLVGRGLIETNSTEIRTLNRPLDPIVITAHGWEHLEHEASNITEKTQVFVAMSFDPSLQSLFNNAIKPAIESAGFRSYRVDSEPHLERIDAKIISEIKNSRFIVADVTQQKAGVYYEAGFAHGLGIPVIWCVKKEDLENVHFDTRQYNHILWETEEELKEQLHYCILATIGEKSHHTRPEVVRQEKKSTNSPAL